MSNVNTEIQSARDKDVYTEWMDEWRELSIPRNCDGRPVWEPPILDYSEWIGEKYEKKREAMLKWTNGDVARTTDIMDVDTEFDLLWEYKGWAEDHAHSAVDSESRKFFEGLGLEVGRDCHVVWREWRGLGGGVYFKRNEDGTYTVNTVRRIRQFSPHSLEDLSSKHRDNISDRASDH